MCKELRSLCPLMFTFEGLLIKCVCAWDTQTHTRPCAHTYKIPSVVGPSLRPPLGQGALFSERENIKEWKILSHCETDIANGHSVRVFTSVRLSWRQAATGRCGLCGSAGSPECSWPTVWHLCGSVGVYEPAPAAGGRPPPTTCCSSERLQTQGVI